MIVVQTERTREYLRSRVTAPVVVIPNPVAPAAEVTTDNQDRDAVILAIGRLQPQKGFDVLLRAFAQASARLASWRLAIAGEGPLRPELAEIARELRVDDRVTFLGVVPDIRPLLQRAGIFALTSRFEGFPNALAEAMAHGCAVVATNCPTGPAELISDGASGLLVPVDDVAALTGALDRLAADAGLRRRLGRAAEQAVTPYRVDRIVQQWNRLLEDVTAAHTPRGT
jgi:glycosyltransferase involved in cell wall biosynthesis